MRFYAPWEKTFDKISTPFDNFLKAQTSTGIVLILTTTLALFLANSQFAETYFHIFHAKISVLVGDFEISHTIHHWINDGLMTLFFFIIGLEIKRKILVGELSDIKVAILPIVAAIGGMVFPALIYLYFNQGLDSASGWGVPMATDLAFAISILVLLKNRVSKSLITFLVALAIVDDLGAVMVIALFYTEQIVIQSLFISLFVFVLMLVLNRSGVQKALPYLLLGIVMWYFMFDSGVHATVAGIVAAMAIPTSPKIVPDSFTKKTNELLVEYDKYEINEDLTLHDEQKTILSKIKNIIVSINPLASRLEHDLHLPIAMIVIPLFALANAGVVIDGEGLKMAFSSPVALGVIFGLILGKIMGIFVVSFLAIKAGLAKLPEGSSFSQIFGVSLLGGIGFTMSIFIGSLAFSTNPELINQSKMAILIASLIAGVSGYLWLRFVGSKNQIHNT